MSGPRKIAKVWFITPITMVYGTYNYSYWGESKPTNITGGPHIAPGYKIILGLMAQSAFVPKRHRRRKSADETSQVFGTSLLGNTSKYLSFYQSLRTPSTWATDCVPNTGIPAECIPTWGWEILEVSGHDLQPQIAGGKIAKLFTHVSLYLDACGYALVESTDGFHIILSMAFTYHS